MDLEKFIENAAQGGKENSTGSFTLGAEAAKKKLLEYPLLLGLHACRTLWHWKMGFTHNAKLHLDYTKKMMRPPPTWTEDETAERLDDLAQALLQYARKCEELGVITRTSPQTPPPPESLEPGR